jgi:hypothetical protein
MGITCKKNSPWLQYIKGTSKESRMDRKTKPIKAKYIGLGKKRANPKDYGKITFACISPFEISPIIS